jgi:hypothetical protein
LLAGFTFRATGLVLLSVALSVAGAVKTDGLTADVVAVLEVDSTFVGLLNSALTNTFASDLPLGFVSAALATGVALASGGLAGCVLTGAAVFSVDVLAAAVLAGVVASDDFFDVAPSDGNEASAGTLTTGRREASE